jgi:general stress protein 26
MKSKGIAFSFSFLVFITLVFHPFIAFSQSTLSPIPRDTLLQAAFDIVKSTPFCALVSVDADGQPQARTMNPFPVEKDWVIWFATSRNSRKVSDIRNNPRVSVYFADHSAAKGYVNVAGTAVIIDDRELLVKMKRDYWEGIPNWQDRFVLIKITPKSLDVVNYARGLSGDPVTSAAPRLVF